MAILTLTLTLTFTSSFFFISWNEKRYREYLDSYRIMGSKKLLNNQINIKNITRKLRDNNKDYFNWKILRANLRLSPTNFDFWYILAIFEWSGFFSEKQPSTLLAFIALSLQADSSEILGAIFEKNCPLANYQLMEPGDYCPRSKIGVASHWRWKKWITYIDEVVTSFISFILLQNVLKRCEKELQQVFRHLWQNIIKMEGSHITSLTVTLCHLTK